MKLQARISNQFYGYNFNGDFRDYVRLNSYVKENLAQLQAMKSVVTTEIRTDEGKTVLFVKRNDRVVLTYYFE